MAQTKTDAASPSREMAELSDQIAVLKNDIAGLTDTLGALAASSRDAAIDTARDKAAKLRAVGDEQFETIRSGARDLGNHATAAVREQPAAAVGMAVAAGFVLGFLTGRK
ncbi:MAG: hypothetical protein R3D85_06415 [Paracoccaceae bacterium]